MFWLRKHYSLSFFIFQNFSQFAHSLILLIIYVQNQSNSYQENTHTVILLTQNVFLFYYLSSIIAI